MEQITVSPRRFSFIKIVAFVLFIILPFIGFWLGREYQKSFISNSQQEIQVMHEPDDFYYSTKEECERTGLQGCECMITDIDSETSNPECRGWKPI